MKIIDRPIANPLQLEAMSRRNRKPARFENFLPTSIERTNSRSPTLIVKGMFNKSFEGRFVAQAQGVSGPGRVKVTAEKKRSYSDYEPAETLRTGMGGLKRAIAKHMKKIGKNDADYGNYKDFLQMVKFAEMPRA
jgi:hypothetical protein